jgi:hypothetical protein
MHLGVPGQRGDMFIGIGTILLILLIVLLVRVL